MTIEPLREASRTRPFRPFTICLADGQRFDVPHPDFLYFPPNSPRTLVVTMPSGAVRLIDRLLVTSLDGENGTALQRRASR